MHGLGIIATKQKDHTEEASSSSRRREDGQEQKSSYFWPIFWRLIKICSFLRLGGSTGSRVPTLRENTLLRVSPILLLNHRSPTHWDQRESLIAIHKDWEKN